MLLVLTFIACSSLTSADRCQHVEIAWEGSLMQCVMYGQVEVARWVSRHDGWEPRQGYRCESGKPV